MMKLKKLLIPLSLMYLMIAGCSEDEAENPVIVVTTKDFAVTVDEEPSKGQVLGQVSGTASSGTVTFSIVSQDPENAMSIDSSTGELKVNEVAAFDYETRTTVIGLVKVASEGASKEAKVTITITDVPVVVTTEDFSVSVDENPVAGQSLGKLTGAASEGSVAFKISKQDVSDALTIDAATGELKVKDASLFDFETRTKLQATVEVTGGSDMKESNITITINNVTEITAEDFSASIDENPTNGQSIGTVVGIADIGEVTYSIISQNPSGALAIDKSTGVLTVKDKSLFDYETNPSIEAVVKVASGEISKEANVSLTLKDLASSWQVLGTAGFTGSVDNLDLAFDIDATPYVAYRDINNSRLVTCKKFVGNAWVTVGNEGFSRTNANAPKMVIDSGTPYVALLLGDDSYPVVMKFDGIQWVFVGVGYAGTSTARYMDFGIDNGILYLAYSDEENSKKCTVRKYDGVSWSTVGAEGISDGGAGFVSLTFLNGVPYVSFADEFASSKSTVMKFNGTSWEAVGAKGFSAGIAQYLSMATDNGLPYLAYTDNGNSAKLTLMKYEGSAWTSVGNAGFTANTSVYTSLAFDKGTPYVAYSDGENDFKSSLMTYNGSQWQLLGQAGFSEGKAEALIMKIYNGVPYVAYRDVANGNKMTVMYYTE